MRRPPVVEGALRSSEWLGGNVDSIVMLTCFVRPGGKPGGGLINRTVFGLGWDLLGTCSPSPPGESVDLSDWRHR